MYQLSWWVKTLEEFFLVLVLNWSCILWVFWCILIWIHIFVSSFFRFERWKRRSVNLKLEDGFDELWDVVIDLQNWVEIACVSDVLESTWCSSLTFPIFWFEWFLWQRIVTVSVSLHRGHNCLVQSSVFTLTKVWDLVVCCKASLNCFSHFLVRVHPSWCLRLWTLSYCCWSSCICRSASSSCRTCTTSNIVISRWVVKVCWHTNISIPVVPLKYSSCYAFCDTKYINQVLYSSCSFLVAHFFL